MPPFRLKVWQEFQSAMKQKFTITMDTEEREILEKFERGDLFSAGSAEDELKTARQAAHNTFNKTRWVTERDFNLARARAREEGIPCQTLLSSVIHKYLSGRLTEKPQETA